MNLIEARHWLKMSWGSDEQAQADAEAVLLSAAQASTETLATPGNWRAAVVFAARLGWRGRDARAANDFVTAQELDLTRRAPPATHP